MSDNSKPSRETLNAWHDDPKNWKLGILYFNREDKRLMLPKRIKSFGWTMNFAQPLAYLLLVAIIVIAIAVGNWVGERLK